MKSQMSQFITMLFFAGSGKMDQALLCRQEGIYMYMDRCSLSCMYVYMYIVALPLSSFNCKFPLNFYLTSRELNVHEW